MSITSFIKKVTPQTAVYWANPQPDGFGKYTYDAPVEILVRWDDISKVISDNQGREITSNATILLNQDVDEQGYLYLGSLADLDSDPVPLTVPKAYMISKKEITPLFKSTTEFVYQCYLTTSRGSTA